MFEKLINISLKPSAEEYFKFKKNSSELFFFFLPRNKDRISVTEYLL